MEYFSAMLAMGIPNIEMHIYGNGRHPGRSPARRQPHVGRFDGSQRPPYGTWQFRFIEWFRNLGFLQKPGVETKAAKDVAPFVAQPPRLFGMGHGNPTAAPVLARVH